ncbi:hypothetical protein [Cellulomonas sp. S1-8]|uniref:hypothetical protein n=1 Tax=Cellulomonas sp. S1-8 TaxID=2904790 RepID=UPI002243F191|nr:hypothetical protein [Cellulomonas sp. S1-8]UZN02426.1 hypothetical protein OKX07_15390 [Cellulomonas sp. S1-8]
MSTRLHLALRDVADAAGDTTAFGDPDDGATTLTVQRLAARVRRRRAVRGAGTAGVAASAVGAVALAGPYLTTQEISPAADPDAAPGTCRSSVATLPTGPSDVLSVELGYVAANGTSGVDAARAGIGLGTWQGGVADLQVAVSQLPVGMTDPSRLRLLVSQDDVVLGSAQYRLDTTITSVPNVLRHEVGLAEPWAGTDPRAVYGLEPEGDVWWDTLPDEQGTIDVAQRVPLDLVACDGSGGLPLGEYDVWVTTVDSLGAARGSAGPWALTVASDVPTATDLPDGFPRTVPLVDGRVVAAHRHGDGWAAEVVTLGDDRARLAADLLSRVALYVDSTGAGLPGPPSATGPVGSAPWVSGVAVPGWLVRVVASQTPDAEPSVVYVLTPTS